MAWIDSKIGLVSRGRNVSITFVATRFSLRNAMY